MVTFDTQEAFEEAVMGVVTRSLTVRVDVVKDRKTYYGNDEYTKVIVALRVNGERVSFSTASDSA